MVRDDDTAPRGAVYVLGALLILGIGAPLFVVAAPDGATAVARHPGPLAAASAHRDAEPKAAPQR